MEKTLSTIGNYLDSITSTTGQSVLNWFATTNPILILILLIAVVAFFFAPMFRYYGSRVYWKLAFWRARAMGRRHRRYSAQAIIADAVVEAVESRVLSGNIDRKTATDFYYDLGVCTGIHDLIPRKKPRKLAALAQEFMKTQIRDRIPDVDKKLEAMREGSNGTPPKVTRVRPRVVHG